MGVFVKIGNDFEKLNDEISSLSINGIAEKLGYHPNQLHTYFGSFNDALISTVSLEIFTANVVFAIGTTDMQYLLKEDVTFFLRDIDLKKEYDSYSVEDILTKGISNKSLHIDFLSKVLNIVDPNPDGLFFIPHLGLNLFFIDGYLVDFQTSDGLSKWGKYLKEINPVLFMNYENISKLHWENNIKMVINEINQQADAFAQIPTGINNEFVSLHKNEFGTINFVMLQVCHYNKQISQTDFVQLNHGRYKKVDIQFGQNPLNVQQYKLGKFTYEFIDETLLKCYLSN